MTEQGPATTSNRSRTRWRLAAVAIVRIGLAVGAAELCGCGDDDQRGTSHDGGDQDTGSDDSGSQISSWVGNWTYVSGTTITECPGGPAMEKPLSGDFAIVQVTANEVAIGEGACVIRFRGTATELIALPAQLCSSEPDPETGVVLVLDLSGATFSVVSETEIDIVREGDLELQGGGTSVHCTARVTGRARRATEH